MSQPHPTGVVVEVTIDAVDAERVAAFWQAALGYRRLYRRPPYIVCGPPEGAIGPHLLIQRVPARPPRPPHSGAGAAPGGAGVHLDLRVADPDGEALRLARLGAVVERVVVEAGSRWLVLRDPEGTLFCLCPPRQAS